MEASPICVFCVWFLSLSTMFSRFSSFVSWHSKMTKYKADTSRDPEKLSPYISAWRTPLCPADVSSLSLFTRHFFVEAFPDPSHQLFSPKFLRLPDSGLTLKRCKITVSYVFSSLLCPQCLVWGLITVRWKKWSVMRNTYQFGFLRKTFKLLGDFLKNSLLPCFRISYVDLKLVLFIVACIYISYLWKNSQDPDNFGCLQGREQGSWGWMEIAVYTLCTFWIFNYIISILKK